MNAVIRKINDMVEDMNDSDENKYALIEYLDYAVSNSLISCEDHLEFMRIVTEFS